MIQELEQFTTAQVAQIVRFSVRQLDYWATSKLIIPSLEQSNGSGTRRLYNFDDLVRLQFIKQLRQEGWSIQKIRIALAHLNEFGTKKPEYRHVKLVHDKHSILILCETEEKRQILLDALKPEGQQVLWIVLELLRGETRKNADRILNVVASKQNNENIAI